MLFDNAINSKKQGDIGMCYAMAYYAKLGWTVSVPVTDSQDYDLVVDNGTRLFKVQVKTTKSISPSGNYWVSLRTIGGNRSGTGKCKDFSENSSDLLFALTDYSIPKSEISAVSSVALGERYLPYRVTLH
jgi:hypothetical protein